MNAKQSFKRITAIIVLILSVTTILCACSTTGTNKNETTPINAEDYQVKDKFITIVDVPPSPFGDLDDYIGAGFTGFILTEDSAKLTVNGTITKEYIEALGKLGDAGLDVYIRNHYNDPEYFQNEDDTTVRNKYSAGGMGGYTLPKRNLTNEFSAYSQIKGFYMADEPVYDNLDDYDNLIDWYNTYYSDTYFHMNLLPSYASTTSLGNGYKSYVQQYIDQIASKVNGHKSICLDNYPFAVKGIIRPSYLSDLLITANKTRDYNATVNDADKAYMGLCIQAFKSNGVLDISCAQDISFQLCVGMAMGSRVYEYFLYNTVLDMQGMVNTDKTKRPVYDYVKEANTYYLGFEKVINAFEWQGLTTFAAVEDRNVENEDAFSAVESLLLTDTGVLSVQDSSARLDAIVGCFKRNGQDGYMVVNYTLPSGGKVNTLNLSFDGCTRALVYTATDNGPVANEIELVDGVARLELGAGEGCFVIPVK